MRKIDQEAGETVSMEAENEKQEGNMKSFIRELIPYVIILGVVILIRVFVLINASIPSSSMTDTIACPSRVMGLKCTYWFSEPQRGDIVVFWAPDLPDTRYVKRIIAVAGDTLQIEGGVVYLNGVELEEPYIREPMRPEDFGPVTVPEGSYFCMGDNRNGSHDARYWENTWVTNDMMIGKVYFSYWPLSEIRWLANTDGDTFAEFQ